MPIQFLRRLSLMAGLCATAAIAQAETWPAADWERAATPAGAAVEAFEAYSFPPRDDQTQAGIRTDAVVVIRDGQLVYERYAGPTKAGTPHLTWSVSKSLMSAIMGVAYGEGRFQLSDPVAKYYPPFAAHPQTKLGHLFNWASGLDWQEDYELAPLRSSVVAMLYTRGHADMGAFTAAHKQGAAPGTRFRYSSGDSTVLAAALKGMVGAEAYKDYPWTALFQPLGITSAVWESDPQGTYVGSSYAYMSARDLARVGLLMQRGGRWQDRQLLPKPWVDFSLTPFADFKAEKPDDAVPAGQWWLNLSFEGAPKPWPDVPPTAFAALGHWGQSLYVLPEQNLVIVRYADDRDHSYQHNEFLKRALAAFAGEVQP
ncbi:serine hydrolase domain-containing protein [Pseudomonas sp. N040]|uniref:serine hydrolase domain-containing protein n=1 Tax=Pseudomonas sp. N040 TaxID=2785325 RepID=UPI0018A2D95E|nr:serine hydrolase [Pseudomonas sp. N040]MBF7729601.1 serine hydrolase [Pseudomonas sp. N040]MBW7013241.1 beta-lactamase family protein [Pseudomonas sp. N040]